MHTLSGFVLPAMTVWTFHVGFSYQTTRFESTTTRSGFLSSLMSATITPYPTVRSVAISWALNFGKVTSAAATGAAASKNSEKVCRIRGGYGFGPAGRGKEV